MKIVASDDPFTREGAVDLLAVAPGTGPLWGLASTDLNATLLAWPPDHVVAEHVNAELDVLVIALSGHGTVVMDGQPHDLPTGSAILLPRGTRRRIEAGHAGLRYLSVHRRRGPLQIEARAAA